MCPLGVVYTKSYNIWSDINPFLEKLGQAYVKSQQTKWENQISLSVIADLEKAQKANEVNTSLEMFNIPKENLDLEGFKPFVTDAMGMLAKKEVMTNPEDFTKPGVQPAKGVSQTQIVPDKKEFGDLFKFVSELPTGKVNWDNTLGLFKEKLESGRAIGSAAQQFLSMIVGQSIPTNQRQKVQQDFEFTQDIRNELFPQTTKKAPNTELEYWLREHPGKGVEDYWKAKDKPEDELKIDVMKFLEENQDEWELGSVNSKGNFTIRRKDTTKKWDFDTWAEAKKWTEANKQPGYQWKIDPQPEGFNVSAEKTPQTPVGGTKKTIPTFGVINNINEALLNPGNDYDTELHNAEIKYNLEGVKLATKADQAKNAYGMFERILVEEEYIDEEGVVKDETAYSDYYNDYEQYAKQYFKETGEILPKKYLSIEEAGKYESMQWAKGKYKGGQKPIFNTENIPWSWQEDVDPTKAIYEQIQRENIRRTEEGKEPLTLDDLDLEELAKKGVDIDKLMKIFQ